MTCRASSFPGLQLHKLQPGIFISRAFSLRSLQVMLTFLILETNFCSGQVLKSIVYDFDGFDVGISALPEGDYKYGDLNYVTAANPLGTSDVLGDRVLEIDINWNAGYGAFGRGITRYLELSKSQDRFNFYFYNPMSNGQSANIQLTIGDDDNQNNTYESGSDDQWRNIQTVPGSAGWQLISIPLSAFTDANAGGNGVFDIGFTQNKGMLLITEFKFTKPGGTPTAAKFYLDFICFSEGTMPVGSSPLALPAKQPGDHCLLGAHQKEDPGKYYLIPQHFEGLFPPGPDKKIRYVNTYMQWATNGSSQPHMLPGQGYQTLLNNGYRPIITWEPSFSGHSLSDPVQPSLSEISSGMFDSYIDNFADALKSYSDTIIVRLMHEFDGDWYPWCVANNQQDPQQFIAAWKHIVDRVRNKGAGKVKWMWCPNSDFAPQAYWNWVVSAYPGDNYVDIVATDVYNSHYPAALPWWRSFRWQYTEIYYYLSKYFPSKPLFICEMACRERESAEPSSSQSKAGWFAMMDKDLQSYFRRTHALIFFNETKTQSWSITSSPAALSSLASNVWADPYYFYPMMPTSITDNAGPGLSFYPNPAHDRLHFPEPNQPATVCVFDASGKMLLEAAVSPASEIDISSLPFGVYLIQLNHLNDETFTYHKLVKE